MLIVFFIYLFCLVNGIFSTEHIAAKENETISRFDDIDNETSELEEFLSGYKSYCMTNLVPLQSNNDSLCPCVPPSLVGKNNISSLVGSDLGELELDLHEFISGGTWQPLSCVPRHRVAIIVPFRDREKHLKLFLKVIHDMLRRQMLYYTIFVVEQKYPKVFNKAALMNAGFKEASAFNEYDCFIFHDVDMLPEDDRNFYTCSDSPRHVGSYVNKWNYSLPYYGLIGGVTAFSKVHFELVNGFSNSFYGWGGEDDDMFRRIQAKNVTISRFPKVVAKYSMIKHHSDDGNPYNAKGSEGFSYRPSFYKTDGLNTLQYTVDKINVRPLYVWISVSLPSHPTYLVTKDMVEQ